MKCLSSYILWLTTLCHALMMAFRIVSNLFRALQLNFYQVKYITPHISGSFDDVLFKYNLYISLAVKVTTNQTLSNSAFPLTTTIKAINMITIFGCQ